MGYSWGAKTSISTSRVGLCPSVMVRYGLMLPACANLIPSAVALLPCQPHAVMVAAKGPQWKSAPEICPSIRIPHDQIDLCH